MLGINTRDELLVELTLAYNWLTFKLGITCDGWVLNLDYLCQLSLQGITRLGVQY